MAILIENKGGNMHSLLCILMGYAVGCINPAFFIAKLHGMDIRKSGSHNAGASNTLILFGKLQGVLCALFDIGKAYFIIWLTAKKLFPDFTWAFAITSVACIIGHVFPFYMKFKGGKGLACFGGMVLCFDWRVFLIFLAAELAIVLLTNYICFVPISASIVFPVVYGFMRSDLVGALILGIATLVMLYKHKENLDRIRRGTEARFSILWNKDKELERLKDKIESEEIEKEEPNE